MYEFVHEHFWTAVFVGWLIVSAVAAVTFDVIMWVRRKKKENKCQ